MSECNRPSAGGGGDRKRTLRYKAVLLQQFYEYAFSARGTPCRSKNRGAHRRKGGWKPGECYRWTIIYRPSSSETRETFPRRFESFPEFLAFKYTSEYRSMSVSIERCDSRRWIRKRCIYVSRRIFIIQKVKRERGAFCDVINILQYTKLIKIDIFQCYLSTLAFTFRRKGMSGQSWILFAASKLTSSLKIQAKQKLRKFDYDRNFVWSYCSQRVASFWWKTEFPDRRKEQGSRSFPVRVWRAYRWLNLILRSALFSPVNNLRHARVHNRVSAGLGEMVSVDRREKRAYPPRKTRDFKDGSRCRGWANISPAKFCHPSLLVIARQTRVLSYYLLLRDTSFSPVL